MSDRITEPHFESKIFKQIFEEQGKTAKDVMLPIKNREEVLPPLKDEKAEKTQAFLDDLSAKDLVNPTEITAQNLWRERRAKPLKKN